MDASGHSVEASEHCVEASGHFGEASVQAGEASEHSVEASQHSVDFLEEIPCWLLVKSLELPFLLIWRCLEFSEDGAGAVFAVVLELSAGFFLVETHFWKILIESVQLVLELSSAELEIFCSFASVPEMSSWCSCLEEASLQDLLSH